MGGPEPEAPTRAADRETEAWEVALAVQGYQASRGGYLAQGPGHDTFHETVSLLWTNCARAPPNVCVEALTPNVTVFGAQAGKGVTKVKRGRQVGP